MRVDLPNGAWAELREPEDVPERLRRPVVAGLSLMLRSNANVAALASSDGDEVASAVTSTFLAAADELNDALILALVKEWSLGAVVPEVLLDAPAGVYDKLRSTSAPLMARLMPDFTPSTDRSSPTSPSSE